MSSIDKFYDLPIEDLLQPQNIDALIAAYRAHRAEGAKPKKEQAEVKIDLVALGLLKPKVEEKRRI